jgi:hypothetical protein
MTQTMSPDCESMLTLTLMLMLMLPALQLLADPPADVQFRVSILDGQRTAPVSAAGIGVPNTPSGDLSRRHPASDRVGSCTG